MSVRWHLKIQLFFMHISYQLPQAGLNWVSLLVLPDVKLLPLQYQVRRAQLDPAGLGPALAITDTHKCVVELPEVWHF